MSSLKSYINQKKKTKLLLLAFFILTVFATGNTFADKTEQQLKTIYHVYLDNERIGTISDPELVNKIVSEKIIPLQQQYPDIHLEVNGELVIVQEKVFITKFEDEYVLNFLNKELTIVAKASSLLVGDKHIAYIRDEQDGHEIIHRMLLEYAPEDIVAKIDNLSYNNPDKDIEPKLNDPTIIDVNLSEEVTFVESKVQPEQIISIEEAIELLKKGTLVDTIHKVQSGEYLGKIAMLYNLSMADILELNPGITTGTLLQIGQELIVTDYEPEVSVTVSEIVQKEEGIAYNEIIKYSDQIYKGESKTTQRGVAGIKRVDYIITKENGKIVNKDAIKEKVIKEPVHKIIVKGTKIIPSRGTGDFIWPVYGGRVTSHMGPRWGSYHKGIDIAGPNRSILAVDNGVVEFASYGYNGGYGTKIIINHNNGYKSLYAHLSQLKVKRGQVVRKGQVIGIMGNTGNSFGTHLHIELRRYGQLINPYYKLK